MRLKELRVSKFFSIQPQRLKLIKKLTVHSTQVNQGLMCHIVSAKALQQALSILAILFAETQFYQSSFISFDRPRCDWSFPGAESVPELPLFMLDSNARDSLTSEGAHAETA